MLKIEKVSLIKRNTPILKQVSCEIRSHEIMFILGKSGSGKTSLLRCLTQIEESYQGQISLNGQSLGSLSPKQRGQSIGFVPQTYALFPHLNILENCIGPLQVILGLERKKAIIKAKEILHSFSMEPWIEAYPHMLSGGQQQRVAIARAVLLDASFILLDEPTSALDPENVNRLINILENLKQQKKGIVIASQDMAFAAKIADRILLIEEGSIVEDANKEECKGRLSRKIEELLGEFSPYFKT